MTDVFVRRTFDPPLTTTDVFNMAADAGSCFNLHQVGWNGSLLSVDGRRMVCWFVARDVESVRIALRQSGSPQGTLFAGTVHEAAQPAPKFERANVLVERSWDDPVALDEIQAREDAGAWCLETHRVKFVRTYFALDHRRMFCLYQAPDAESVRLAQREAAMPVDRVWAFQRITP